MKHVGAVLSMSFWIVVLCWCAWWLLRQGWWLMGHDWIWCGLGVVVVGGVLTVVCGRGVGLVLVLMAGKTTPRLAKRDFRNSLANMIMFAKTGLWKE